MKRRSPVNDIQSLLLVSNIIDNNYHEDYVEICEQLLAKYLGLIE